jgi:hypothetical protein
MAAALATLNNYLDNTLGIDDQNTRDALNQQGIQAFDDFLTLTEKDISDICANIRKPGGTIPNPLHNAAAPVANIPAVIPNPGINIGYVYEKRLKMLRYYLVLRLERVQRVIGVNTATLARLITCYRLKEIEDEAEEIDLPIKLTRVDKVRDILENRDNYLLQQRGASGLPLAYVVRPEAALPNVDPGYGQPSVIEEMIARGPHAGPYYQLDNKAVWQVIRHVTHEGPGWSWVQGYQRTSDGRQAYLALKAHYLGESYSSRIRAAADSTIDNAYYDGKSRAFTFEKYCEILKAAFTDIEATGEAVSETRKVRVLLHGICDKRLETAISQVMATAELRDTFDTALNFIARFADDMKSLDNSRKVSHRNISGVSSRGGRGGRSGRGANPGRGHGAGGYQGNRAARGRMNNPKVNVEDRYYPWEEWKELTQTQKDKVRELKQKREKQQRTVNSNSTDTNRNVRYKSDDNTITSDVTPSTRVSEIGAVMTQRNL